MQRAARRWTIVCFALVLSASMSAVAHAGPGYWTTGGPRVEAAAGGPCESGIPTPTIDPSTPSTLYSICHGQVFKSINSGKSWALANAGLPSVGRILIDPKTPSTLYATGSAGYGRSIFKTVDAGGTWTAVHSGDIVFDNSTLTIDPQTPSTLYIGSAVGVFKSTDAGETWTATSSGLGHPAVTALAIDPVTPSTLYAASRRSAGKFGALYAWIHKSTDSGSSWVDMGLPWLGTNTIVAAFAIDPITPSTVYAVVVGLQYPDEGGLMKSTDSAASWHGVGIGLLGYEDIRDIAIDPVAPSTLYAVTHLGLFKSSDSGGNWASANPGTDGPYLYTVAIDPKTHTKLYGGASGGAFFTSVDSGANWSAVATGPRPLEVWALAVDPGAAGTVYAGTKDGIYKSTDSGVTWTATNAGLPAKKEIRALAIDPANPSTLYAAANPGGIFRSTDSGGTWAAASSGVPPNAIIGALAIDSATPATLYAAANSGGIFRSTDSGGTWAAANSGVPPNAIIGALAIDPASPSTIYAGTAYAGLFKSSDSGATWTAANTGLSENESINELAIDPVVHTTLYAGTYRGVFRSIDSGDTWVAAGTGATPSPVASLLIDSTRPSTLYAGTWAGYAETPASDVFKSTDSGETWTSINTGLPTASVAALALEPSGAKTLYAGSLGVWQLGATVPADFYTVTPCRIFDSRDALLGGPTALGAGNTTTVPVANQCGIPPAATAAAVNVTVTAPYGQGHLRLYADDTLLPTTSTINYTAGQTRANNAVVGLGAAGALNVYVGQQSGDVHVIIDVSGYFQ